MGAAVRYLLDTGPENVFAAVAANAAYLRTQLPTLPGVTVRDLGTEHSGIVSFTIDRIDPIEVRDRLHESDITVTVSHRGSTLLDMSARHLDSVVRASPHCFVTTAELDRFLDSMERLVRAN